MTLQQAITFLATLLALPDASGVKALIIAIAQAAGLDTTSFVPGDPAERFLEIAARAMAAWGSVPTQAVRGAFLALATDPGDVDDFNVRDQSADQTPRPGFLSATGQGYFGTTRGAQTYATSFLTIKNNGATPTTAFTPGQLLCQDSTDSHSDGGLATYTGTAAPLIYTGLGGTMPPIAAGASVANVPVVANQAGVYGSAAAGKIDKVVSQSFGNLTITASTTATGQEREARLAYIARCLLAMNKLSPGGPQKGYLYAMNTAADGTALQRYDGTGPCAITQAYVSPDSVNGQVTIYYATPTGVPSQVDIDTANANIIGLLVADPNVTASTVYRNPNPLGILPDTVALLPYVYGVTVPQIIPVGTPGGAACTTSAIAITASAKIKSSSIPGAPLGTYTSTYDSSLATPLTTAATTVIANVLNAISLALVAYLPGVGIGGLDQTALGAGVIYTADIVPVVRDAQKGLYDVIVTAPAGATSPLAPGQIAITGTHVSIITLSLQVVAG